MGRNTKGKVSVVIYAIGAALAFVQPLASVSAYVLVSMICFIPDRRVDRVLGLSRSLRRPRQHGHGHFRAKPEA